MWQPFLSVVRVSGSAARAVGQHPGHSIDSRYERDQGTLRRLTVEADHLPDPGRAGAHADTALGEGHRELVEIPTPAR